MVQREKILHMITPQSSDIIQELKTLFYNEKKHQNYWEKIRADIETENKNYNYTMDIFFHKFDTFFSVSL